MVLPSSGALTFSNIQTEFGGSNPVNLNEYYRNASFTAFNTSVPTSGEIKVSNFYGTQAVNINNYTDSNFGGYPTYMYYFVTSGGKAAYSYDSGGINPVDIETWFGGIGSISDYEVQVTNVSGALSGSAQDTWLALTSTRSWYVESPYLDSSTATFTVQLRRSGGSVLDSADIDITAGSF